MGWGGSSSDNSRWWHVRREINGMGTHGTYHWTGTSTSYRFYSVLCRGNWAWKLKSEEDGKAFIYVIIRGQKSTISLRKSIIYLRKRGYGIYIYIYNWLTDWLCEQKWWMSEIRETDTPEKQEGTTFAAPSVFKDQIHRSLSQLWIRNAPSRLSGTWDVFTRSSRYSYIENTETGWKRKSGNFVDSFDYVLLLALHLLLVANNCQLDQWQEDKCHRTEHPHIWKQFCD